MVITYCTFIRDRALCICCATEMTIRKCQIHRTIITLEYVIKYGGGYSDVISLPKPFRPYHNELDFGCGLKILPKPFTPNFST